MVRHIYNYQDLGNYASAQSAAFFLMVNGLLLIGAEALRRLVSQVTSPVRFDSCLATLRDLGVTAVVELPPAGALAGLAKREWKGSDIEILAVAAPNDLDRARELLGGTA